MTVNHSRAAVARFLSRLYFRIAQRTKYSLMFRKDGYSLDR